MRIRLSPAAFALLYAIVAGGWIVLSHLFLMTAADPLERDGMEIAKGLLFVLVTGALLFAMLRRRDAQAAREEAERQSLQAGRQAAQAESDRLLRHFFQLPFIGMAISETGTGRWLRFNDRLCEILGYTREELERRTWMDITHPDDLGRNLAAYRSGLAGEIEGYQLEKRFIRGDGSVIVTEIDVRIVRRADGAPDYFVTTIEDVTERSRARERILRQSRFYAGLSAFNAAVARCASREELFETVCHVAVDSAGFRLAWIGITGADGAVRIESRHGAGQDYLDGITITTSATEQSGRGPTGTAIRENEAIWCDDFLADPRTAPWRERGRAHGFGASAAVPIRRGGLAIGAITLYAGHANAFDADARRLLLDLAANLSFAMDNIDREAARREAEAALRSSEERYRLIYSRSRDAILLGTPDGRIFAANEAACRLLRRTEAEIVSLGRAGVVDPGDPRVAQAVAERSRRGEFEGVLTMRRSDGSRFEAEVSSTLYTDSRGETRTTLIVRDATERLRLDEERAFYTRRSEALLALPAAAERMDEKAFIRFSLEQAVRLTASRAAFAYLVDDDDATLVPFTASGPGDALPEGFADGSRRSVREAGEWGEALRRRVPVVVNAGPDRRDGPGTGPGSIGPARLASVPVDNGARIDLLAVVTGKASDYVERDLQSLRLVTSEAWRIVQVRRAQRLLRESEARYRTAFITTPDAMTITDLESGRYLAVNEGFVTSFGWSSDEAVGRTSVELGLWPSAPSRSAFAAAVMAEGRCRDYEARLRRKDGNEILALVSAHVIEVEGHPCILAMTRDNTERRRAEETVRKLSLAVEQSPESIVITNLEAEIEYVNRAFLENTGYAPEDVLGKNPRILQSGRTPAATYDAMWATLAGGEVWKGELFNRRKDGREYVEFAIIAPIRQADGVVTHYLAVKDDITEKKRIGEELTAYRHHLEDLVRNRTEELAEARERAEAANAAKSAFLATMSHEIRTPMNAILGFTRLLERDQPRADQVDRLAKLGTATRHLLALIDDILDLSKIEAGKLSIDEHAFDPAALLSEVEDMLRDRASAKGLALAAACDPATPASVVGDPLRIRQVLVNLGGNAVKFTERGRIALRAVPVSADGRAARLRFEVVDTGIGIRAEQRPRLFNRFEQADGTTTRRYGGTGLGLAVSKRLVDLMGGTIGFESEEGHGSTFWFEVPLVASGEPAGRAPESRRLESAAHAVPALRILLAEDDPVNQEIATDLLVHLGHEVHVAADGAKAVATASASLFDLVLMDLQMPVMDGLEATRALRGMRAYAAAPILAMTASVLEEDRRHCLEAGMSDIVAKPVDPADLERAIARWAPANPVGVAAPGPRAPAGRDAAAPTLIERLAGIEGLDAPAGLARMLGRADAYERLLRSFAARHAGDALALRASLAAREFDPARRLAHTIKGAAGALGARAVSAAAAEIEAALVRSPAGGDFPWPLVDRFEQAHGALVGALAAAIPEADFTEGATVDPARLAAVSADLALLLEGSDIRAGTLARRERALLRAAYGDAAREIEAHLDAFDFGAALERLRQASPPAAPNDG